VARFGHDPANGHAQTLRFTILHDPSPGASAAATQSIADAAAFHHAVGGVMSVASQSCAHACY